MACRVPNALPGRGSVNVEIFGMAGVPDGAAPGVTVPIGVTDKQLSGTLLTHPESKTADQCNSSQPLLLSVLHMTAYAFDPVPCWWSAQLTAYIASSLCDTHPSFAPACRRRVRQQAGGPWARHCSSCTCCSYLPWTAASGVWLPPSVWSSYVSCFPYVYI